MSETLTRNTDLKGREIDPIEFHKWERENDPVPVGPTGHLSELGETPKCWLAPSGEMVANGHPFFPSALVPAPTHPLDLWRKQVDYARADLAWAEEDFRNLKRQSLGYEIEFGWSMKWRPSYGTQTGNAVTDLRVLAAAIRKKREAWTAIYEVNIPDEVRRERKKKADMERSDAEWESHQEAERANRRNEIQSIEP